MRKERMGVRKSMLRVGTAISLAFAFATPASAVVLGFDNISANNVTNAASGEAQLGVEVTDAGSNQVSFRFFNTGPAASSIADVYFDDGTLLGIAALIDADDGVGGDSGVDFTQFASPSNLPSANSVSPPFETTVGFSADSDSPAQPNGVNPGEELYVIFDLIGGQDFNDTLAALDLGGNTGGLRIGIHVQGFANGGSESFVNTPPDDPLPPAQNVAEPETLLLLGLAFAGLGVGSMRRRRRSSPPLV
jgi:hypothetical protein